MEARSLIYRLYEIFSSGISDKKPEFDTPETERALNSFIAAFAKKQIHEDSLGITFMYDYFCYAYGCLTIGGDNLRSIPLGWVLGAPQLKRWEEKPDSYQFLYREGFLSKVKIPPLSELKIQLRPKVERPLLDVSEEYEKQRFHSSADGFVNCLLLTTLYQPESKWCTGCSNKENCIEELKIRNPRVALKRKLIKL